MTRLTLIFCATALLPHLAPAKRSAPPNVEPVIHDGIRYVAPNDDGRRAYIEAWEVLTNKKLWDLTVFTNGIDPKLEQDVQWIFINKLSVRDDTLLVTSEHGRRYQIDLQTKTIKESEPGLSQASQPVAQGRDIPKVVKRVIANGWLPREYELSSHVNPSYLRADLNGDGKSDFAVLIKQRSGGKLGIAIINGATDKVTILGAGTAFGNGGDDFEWMDSWEIQAKDRPTNGIRIPKRGDALLVTKNEAASGLIYWNGKRYAWLQYDD